MRFGSSLCNWKFPPIEMAYWDGYEAGSSDLPSIPPPNYTDSFRKAYLAGFEQGHTDFLDPQFPS